MRLSSALYGLACLSFATAYPGSKRITSTETDLSSRNDHGSISRRSKDPVLIDMHNWGKNAAKKVYKGCRDPLVADADQPLKKVWDGLGCHYLESALQANASADSETKGSVLSYVGRISNRVHGPEGLDCADMEDTKCSGLVLQCDDTPAFGCAYKILNSLSRIHDLYRTAYDQIFEVHDSMQDILPSLFDIFAPDADEEDDTMVADIIVGIVTMGAVGAGAVADKFVKGVMKATKNGYQSVRDGMLLGAASGTPVALNHIGPDDLDDDQVNNRLLVLFNKFYHMLRDEQLKNLERIFDGSVQSRLALSYMMDDGAMLNVDKKPNVDFGLKDTITKVFLGFMIPKAWNNAPKLKGDDNNAYSHPFFVNSNKPCGETPDDYYYATDDKDFTEICFNDEAWYLMVVHAYRDADDLDQMKWKWSLNGPPGDTSLISGDSFYGVTAEDLLASAYGGWKKGGKKQYWTMPSNQKLITGDSPTSKKQLLTGGVREGGLAQVLICDNFQDTVDNIDDVVHGSDSEQGKQLDLPKTFPCDY